jgi:hypothetical protein
LYNYEVREVKGGDGFDFGGKGLEATRAHLNNGVLSRLLSQYAENGVPGWYGLVSKEKTVALFCKYLSTLTCHPLTHESAAVAMRVGATFSEDDMKLLRKIYEGEFVDDGEYGAYVDFGGPMKEQFKIAVDHYKNDGTPYDFHAPRYNAPGCHKADDELPENEPLMACGKCRAFRYCSEKCQKAHWKMHKKICKTPEDRTDEENYMYSELGASSRGLVQVANQTLTSKNSGNLQN